MYSIYQKKAFTLVEVVIVLGVLAAMFSSVVFVLTSIEKVPAIYEKNRAVADSLREVDMGLRSIAKSDFANIQNGIYGIVYTNGTWSLTASSNTKEGITRSIQIADSADGGKQITTTLSWVQDGKNVQNNFYSRLYNYKNITPSTQADAVQIDTSGYTVASGTVRNINISNTSTINSLTITHIKITFSNTTRKLLRLRMSTPNTTVWSSTGPGAPSGTQVSGTVIDISDYIIAPGTTKELIVLFDGAIAPSTYSIEFTLSDGSTKTVSF